MANETDFLDLYRRLNVKPDCGVAELKRAYRRHVSRLHPDRHGEGSPNLKAAALLQQLTAQYGSAMEFQRRYGRLPGAAGSGREGVFEAPAGNRPVSVASAVTTQHSRRRALMLWLGSLVLLWVIVSPMRSPKEVPAVDSRQPESDSIKRVAAPSPIPSGKLRLGMSSAHVRDIEGDPLAIHDDLWEYGPSWISFHNDRVVDWYSSPLHSLRTVDGRPTDTGR